MQVQRDGSDVASYDYDDNGNRVHADDGNGDREASYGPDDRLLAEGDRSYERVLFFLAGGPGERVFRWWRVQVWGLPSHTFSSPTATADQRDGPDKSSGKT